MRKNIAAIVSSALGVVLAAALLLLSEVPGMEKGGFPYDPAAARAAVKIVCAVGIAVFVGIFAVVAFRLRRRSVQRENYPAPGRRPSHVR